MINIWSRVLLLTLILISPEYIFSQICSKSQLPSNLQTGLVAYYPFCGNANDASGNGNNGTVFGPTLSTDRFGNSNAAYSFNGSSNYIEVANSNSISIQTNFSASVWILMDGGSCNPRVFEINQDLNVCGGYSLSVNGNSNVSRTIHTAHSGSCTSTIGLNPSNPITALTWHHLAFTIEGTTGIGNFYLDGQKIQTIQGPTISAFSYNGNKLTIGNINSGRCDWWGGKIDDLLLYNRVLNACEINQIYNSTTGSIGQLQDLDFNTLPDTTKVCGSSAPLNAAAGFSSYSWNTGATTQSIAPTSSGLYKVTVTNASGCTASDSTYLSIVKANIIQADTTICKGSSIKLNIDSALSSSTSCNPVTLPTALKNGLVAYFPFCGNANDATGNGNNGIVYGAVMATDRFGNPNSAYSFNGTTHYIQTASLSKSITNKTYSAWVKLSTLNQSAGGLAGIQSSGGQIFDVVVYNETNNGWGFGSDNLTRSQWSGVKETVSEWAMITATYEQNSYKIYRNGILIGSTTQFGITNFGTTAKINIGYRHTFGGSPYLNALIDDVYVYDRVLTPQEINSLYKSTSVSWSTGSTSNSITVSPTQTTKYYVTVSDGITSCQDSVTVTVSDIGSFNPLQDTTRVCGDSAILDAGSGYAAYSWNTGATTQSIVSKSSAFYKVIVTNAAGCTSSDSTYLSLVNANIINNDTTICLGSSVILNIDTTSFGFRSSSIYNSGAPNPWPSGSLADKGAIDLGVFGQKSIFSVSFWVNPSHVQNGITVILDCSHSGGTNWVLQTTNSGNTWAWSNLAFSLTPNQWQHVLLTYNNGLKKVYVNGLLTASHTQPFTYSGSPNLYLGNWPEGGRRFRGFIDELYVTNFISQNGNFSPENEITSPSTNSMGLWKFNEGQGLTTLNSIANLNTNLNNWTWGSRSSFSSTSWSTGASSNKITVSPTQSTTYYVTVSDGVTSCTDSVRVTVNDIGSFNPLQDTIRVCGDSITLDAGAGFSQYKWSNGATTQKIVAKSSGKYSVVVTNAAGCSASDSSLVSIVKAKIIQRDTTICSSNSISLTLESNTTIKANYSIGEKGPAGGIVFYDKGSSSNGWRYLEAAPFDLGVAQWGCFGNTLTGAGGLFFGDGKINSAELMSNLCIQPSHAVALCDTFKFGGFNDWFLPSREELLRLGAVSTLVGGFPPKNSTVYYYWSSSKFSLDNGFGAWAVNINGDGAVLTKDRNVAVRAIRSFDAVPTSITWSNGATTDSINVSPTQTTKYFVTVSDGITSCRDSITLTVASVDTALTVLDNPSICSNGGTVRMQAKAGASEYQWKRNGLAITGANSALYTATQSGIYHVVLTGNVGCQDSSRTITVAIRPVPTPNFTINSSSQCLNENNFIYTNTSTISSGSMLYSWDFGDGSSSTSISPSKKYNRSGTYTIKLVSTSNNLCVDSISKQITVLGDADSSISVLDPAEVCSTGSSVRIQAGNAASYSWIRDGIVLTGSTASLFSATQSGNYQVIVRSSEGCADTSRIVSIVLNPQPVANFTINSIAQCLTENGFNFTNSSTISAGSMNYAWTLGDGTTAISINASRTYTTAGTYNIKLVATSNKLCKDSITKTITVYPQPQIPVITGPNEFCKGSNINLQTTGSPVLTWFKNDVLLAGETLNTLRVNQAGDYKVVSANNNGCKSSSVVKTVIENLLPVGTFNKPSTLNICDGSSLTLSASGASTYQWFYNTNPILGATKATYNAMAAGTYSVDFISNKGCLAKGTTTYTLVLLKKPVSSFIFDTYCAGVQTNFSSKSLVSQSGLVRYFWQFGDGKVSSNGQNAFNTYSTAGTYRAKLVVTPVECPQLADSTTILIPVEPSPAGLKYPPVNAIINRAQQLTARNIGTTYQWTPSIYLSSFTSRTPTITTSKEQQYLIYITNQAGCNIVDTQLVRVFPDRNIYVPEGFTPDNDGHNDRLYPILVGISEMRVFRIFNRWGTLVFDNKNATVNTGWNGTYLGRTQPMDTYAWVAEGIDVDGKPITRTGNTILIR